MAAAPRPGGDVRRRRRRAWLVGFALLVLGAPVIGAVFPSSVRIPRKPTTQSNPLPAALFSHRTHGTMGCFTCHPAVFAQAPAAFTHQDMGHGRFCGHCHDGRTAFAVTGTPCGTCHVPAL